jgi:OPT oligopeptide transporter protein
MLVGFPIGKAWARYMPNVSLFGISLNPGPFTIKEHIIVMIIAAAGSNPDYAVGTEFDKLCPIVVLMPLLDLHYFRAEGLLQSAP